MLASLCGGGSPWGQWVDVLLWVLWVLMELWGSLGVTWPRQEGADRLPCSSDVDLQVPPCLCAHCPSHLFKQSSFLCLEIGLPGSQSQLRIFPALRPNKSLNCFEPVQPVQGGIGPSFSENCEGGIGCQESPVPGM